MLLTFASACGLNGSCFLVLSQMASAIYTSNLHGAYETRFPCAHNATFSIIAIWVVVYLKSKNLRDHSLNLISGNAGYICARAPTPKLQQQHPRIATATS
jgi:hypothetical protein